MHTVRGPPSRSHGEGGACTACANCVPVPLQVPKQDRGGGGGGRAGPPPPGRASGRERGKEKRGGSAARLPSACAAAAGEAGRANLQRASVFRRDIHQKARRVGPARARPRPRAPKRPAAPSHGRLKQPASSPAGTFLVATHPHCTHTPSQLVAHGAAHSAARYSRVPGATAPRSAARAALRRAFPLSDRGGWGKQRAHGAPTLSARRARHAGVYASPSLFQSDSELRCFLRAAEAARTPNGLTPARTRRCALARRRGDKTSFATSRPTPQTPPYTPSADSDVGVGRMLRGPRAPRSHFRAPTRHLPRSARGW